MNTLIYWFGSALVLLLQALPLTWVARLGRAGGALAYRLDARHRRVALANLTMCFGQEKSLREIRELARENFRRIGENYASAVKTAAMSYEALRPHLEYTGWQSLLPVRRVDQCLRPFREFRIVRAGRRRGPGVSQRHNLPRLEPAGNQSPDGKTASPLRLPVF